MKREISYWLNARDKPGLLVSLIKALAGDARMGLCGDISQFDFDHIQKTDYRGLLEDTDSDCVALLLNEETINPIMKQIIPEAKCVHAVDQIAIEKSGQVEVVIGDNFHNECISVGPGVSIDLLEQLIANGVLRSITPHSEIKNKHPNAWKNKK